MRPLSGPSSRESDPTQLPVVFRPGDARLSDESARLDAEAVCRRRHRHHALYGATDTVKPKMAEGARNGIPLDRLGQPEEIAEAVYFLLSPADS